MTKRTFVAVKINPSTKLLSEYDKIKKTLKNSPIKWVSFEALHITLKFLGDTDVSVLDDLYDELSKITNNYASDEISISRVGVFPNINNPKVLWFGIDNQILLSKLSSEINKAFVKYGFEIEKRQFSPHLTIARIKFVKEIEQFRQILSLYKNVVFQNVKIEKLIFFESTLTPQGAKYNVLKEFNLMK